MISILPDTTVITTAEEEQSVSIRVHIHRTHRQFTSGLSSVEVSGDTVGTCLTHLIHQHPAMEKALFAGKGKLLKSVEIYVNGKSAYPDEMTCTVRDGDEIHIILMLVGG